VVEWSGTLVLSTPRLLLRTFRRDDLPHYATLNADPKVARYLGGPLTREDSDDIAAWAQECHAREGLGLLAVERRQDGAFLGMCGLHHQESYPDDVEVAWRLAREHWGQGYATEARPVAGPCVRNAEPPAGHLHHRPAEPAQPGRDAPARDGVRPPGRDRGHGMIFQAVIYAITAEQWRSRAAARRRGVH
jgi:RimJ/RimL family protein N-acetyltransferase